MRFYRMIGILGGFIFFLPFVGFPRVWDDIFLAMSGGLLLLTAWGVRVQYRAMFAGVLKHAEDTRAVFVDNVLPRRRRRNGRETPVIVEKRVLVQSDVVPADLVVEKDSAYARASGYEE